MDEADVLGDKIVIMKSGQIAAVGTSLVLKKKFGAGYLVSITMKRQGEAARRRVEALCREFAPNMTATSPTPAMLRLRVPDGGDADQTLGAMFRELENRQQELDIEDFILSLTTLEEVFLKVAEEPAHEHKTAKQSSTLRKVLIGCCAVFTCIIVVVLIAGLVFFVRVSEKGN